MLQSHELAAEGDSPIPAADRQALRDHLLEGLIRHTSYTECLLMMLGYRSSVSWAKLALICLCAALDSI